MASIETGGLRRMQLPEAYHGMTAGVEAVVPRPRGRPAGAKSRVLARGRDIGHHQIAFLRAWFQGIDLHQAWQRYLSFAGGSADLRVIERTRSELLDELLAAGHQADLSHPHLGLKRALDVLARDRQSSDAAPIPSLEEWVAAEEIDPDFSEAELLEMYREHHGLDSVVDEGAGPVDVNEQLRALNVVADVLTKSPTADDRLALWLAPDLARALQAAGTTTIEALIARIQRAPTHWYAGVAGLGERRANSIRAWLDGLSPSIGSRAATHLDAHDVRLSGPVFVSLDVRNAEAIAAASGLQADVVASDLTTLRSWLDRLSGSEHTRRAYRREVERFYFWTVAVRHKPLSALDTTDGDAYREFLVDLPAHWIQPLPVPREHARWRPFRCVLSASSQKQALVVVRLFCAGLVGAGVLKVKPVEGHVSVARAPALSEMPALSVRRLAEADTTGRQLHAGRRELLLQLAAAIPLKLTELAGLQRRALSHGPGGWQLQIERRGRARVWAVPQPLAELLERHQAEARAMGCPGNGESPLIWTIARQGSPATALSAAGIHQCLKRLALRAGAGSTHGYRRFSIRQLRQAAVDEPPDGPLTA
jgi:site-specific recombinase XerD